jgi:hypothetical protein
MTGEIRQEPTQVPIDGGKDVTLEPGKPWPSVYRGSKYSLVESRRRNRGKVVRWQHKDLQAYCEPPEGLARVMQEVGKSMGDGTGSFRITAGSEVLTKVSADAYRYSDEAPHSDGWIPVYLGELDGKVGFAEINNDPQPQVGSVAVWDGFPFAHGERWSVSVGNTLIWKRGDYRFESAFDHPELIGAYNEYRDRAGRMYINEYGHVRINVPSAELPPKKEQEIQQLVDGWREAAERQNNTQAIRLVTRRLKATSPDDDPENGHLPVYLGHLEEFDGGVIPRPVVTDMSYFVDTSHDPSDSFS